MGLTLLNPPARTSANAGASQAPVDLEETGLPLVFLIQLVSKTLFQAGQLRLAELSSRLKLPSRIVEELLDFMRRERLVEVTSTSTGAQRCFQLTGLGRERAEEYLRRNQYVGPAPVTLAAYEQQVRRQAVGDLVVGRADMERAFHGIVVSESILDQLGAAMNSGRAIFLYGPAGAGKSFIAERLTELMVDDVYVPHALLVRDEIIRVFDPNTHVARDEGNESADSVHAAECDSRWVRCRRPVVITGGELTIDMLDLQFEQSARFYAAPPQLKANNGLLIIDDLGRQKVAPRELMNRWIVPLDRKLDYLALHTGEKFMVPFDVTVVFSTNIAPAELADEAFLRRLGYKILIGALAPGQYRHVCEQVCRSLGIAYDSASIDRLIARFYAEQRPLLACTPRDLLGQMRDQARYQRIPVALTDELLDWAWKNYFVAV